MSKRRPTLQDEIDNAAICKAQGKPAGMSALGIGTCGDHKPGSLNFKEWLRLQEVGTGTNAVAMFKRPIFGDPIRRSALGPWGEEDPFFKKRRKVDEHGGDPTAYGSTLGSDPDGQSLPQSYLKADMPMNRGTGPEGDQPTLSMPIKLMKRRMRKK